MEGKLQFGLVLEKEGEPPVYKEFPIRKLQEGELLIKVQGSTVNPADRLVIEGYFSLKRQLPSLVGYEGTGVVVQAKGEALQKWIGKRVCFQTPHGSWCQYSVTTADQVFQIQKDVPLGSAASGFVNPLTVIGMVENYKTLEGKGIIHTAAASSLGRMLNKLCIKYQIPLLCLVRKQEQAELLKKQGATKVLVTTGDWIKKFKQIIQKEGFNVVYDALGGGPITQAIISNLNPNSIYHMYGKMQKDPFTLHDPTPLFIGVRIFSFNVDTWWSKANHEVNERVRKQHSHLLKNELATHTIKEFTFKQIEQAIELSVKKSSQGKILLTP